MTVSLLTQEKSRCHIVTLIAHHNHQPLQVEQALEISLISRF